MLPRFTLRTILALTTVLALFFVLVGAGARGQLWAQGATIGVVSIALSFVAQAALFGFVWCIARLSSGGANKSGKSQTTADREAAT